VRMRNPGLPKVAIFGVKSIDELPPAEQLRSHYAESYETDQFSISVFADDSELERVLAELEPQAIVSIGVIETFRNLLAAPYYIRRKWIHKERAQDLRGSDIFHCFLIAALPTSTNPAAPRKISVFTPVYNTGRDKLLRAYRSLQNQTYADWEWVLADDHSDDAGTLDALREIARDYRASIHNLAKPSGNIGQLKGHLCAVASGEILLEFDHDDVLTPHALAWIAEAFRRHPECGVAYTNWTERYEGSTHCHHYGSDYAFGYGKAHWESHAQRYETFAQETAEYLVQDALHLNAKTIRHIVGVPNHVRAWTRTAYVAAGGYSSLHVADDYELMVRLFLTTRFVHVPKLCYVQFYNTASIGNTQKARNKEIQRVVRFVSEHYDRRIHERLLELGVDDFVWDAAAGRSDFRRANPEVESHCTLVLSDG
jgi:glycosyltransferase involved in cell wall biosynthesis